MGNIGLALCNDKIDNSEMAISLLKLSLTKNIDNNIKQDISQHLVDIYLKIAKKYELTSYKDTQFIQYSLQYYKEGLEVLKASNTDSLKEGEISNKIGDLYFKLKDYDNCLEYNKYFLYKCQNSSVLLLGK